MTDPDVTDHQLLTRFARARDPEAFAHLVARHGNWVYATARRHIGDAHLAEDITQAVFLLLAQKAPTMRPTTLLSAWLFSATCYTARTARRTAARRAHRERLLAQEPQQDPPQAAMAPTLWQELEPKLDAALSALPALDRNALILRYYQDKPLQEVGTLLTLSEEAARKRIARALEKLRLRLGATAVTPAALAATILASSTQPAPAPLLTALTPTALGHVSASASITSLAQGASTMFATAKLTLAAAVVAAVLVLAGTTTLVVSALAAPPAPTTPPTPGRPVPKNKELTLDLGDKVTMKLAQIPAGKFLMGSPETEKDHQPNETPHEVTISKPFYLGITEVTQEQYEAVMGKNPSTFKGPTNPVENVSWDEAVDFCKKLSAKVNKAVRLPMEAEWEYACRAGSTTRFGFGDSETDLGDYAWYQGNSASATHPVGQKKPNAWGLYDMHGNVWEWCHDRYGDYGKGAATDPTGADTGSSRVLRGGSWFYGAWDCPSAFRRMHDPDGRVGRLGFRVVVVAASVD